MKSRNTSFFFFPRLFLLPTAVCEEHIKGDGEAFCLLRLRGAAERGPLTAVLMRRIPYYDMTRLFKFGWTQPGGDEKEENKRE